MAQMGDGYGSECHLLRFMGRHRELFNKCVVENIGAEAVRWLDSHFDPTKRWKDGERKGLDFLIGAPALGIWSDFWPQRGNAPNWDAVGVATMRGKDEWVLVEAKAHIGELNSSCQASEDGGLRKIKKALEHTKQALCISSERDWLTHYYQFANRVAILNFLVENQVPARLLFIYFVGDEFPKDKFPKQECPTDELGWDSALRDQSQWLGLDKPHALEGRIHKLFLPVSLTT